MAKKEYIYNEQDQLITKLVLAVDAQSEMTTNYEYDDAGNLISEVQSNGEKKEYSYENNQLICVTEYTPEEKFSPEETIVSYYESGKLMRIERYSGDHISTRESYTYDGEALISFIREHLEDGEFAVVYKELYSYDEGGQVCKLECWHNGQLDESKTFEYIEITVPESQVALIDLAKSEIE